MINLLPMILAVCMVGEAGWTIQITLEPIPIVGSTTEEVGSTTGSSAQSSGQSSAQSSYEPEQLTATYEEPIYCESESEPEQSATYEETTSDDDGDWEYLGEHQITGYVATGNPCASGVYPYIGCCACNGLPIGTVVYVEDYGYLTVEDRGGMTDPYWIDIFMSSVSECYAITSVRGVWIVR